MAAVRHLGFGGRLLGPPTMTSWQSLSLCQIWLKSMQQFRQHETFNILPVWLENDYSCPKNCFLGYFTPIMGSNVNKTPKRHILARVRVIRAIRRENPSTGPMKKRYKKVKFSLYFTYLPRSPSVDGFALSLAQPQGLPT